MQKGEAKPSFFNHYPPSKKKEGKKEEREGGRKGERRKTPINLFRTAISSGRRWHVTIGMNSLFLIFVLTF